MIELVEKLFEQSWNYINRNNIIRRLQKTSYDILIIGGGITGAGIAREATIRGLKVGLIEMQDFAAGTSSRSSKLAHGGLRYLAYGELDLVKEATTERNWMRAHIPHLIRPVPFLWVNWKGDTSNKQSIEFALKLYDSLSDDSQEYKNFKKYQWFSAEDLQNLEPEIKDRVNQGGAIYYDTNVDDARLTIETLKEAVIRGADVISYCKAVGYVLENNKIIGIKCHDLENDKYFNIKGTLIVNATGIWSDDQLSDYPENVSKPLIRPTKGVHLIFKRKHIQNENAVIIPSFSDNRGIFVLPRGDFSIIGTSDTDFKGDIANPFCSKEDADYFINSVKNCFPNAKIGYDNIVATYAGVRPLVKEIGKSEIEVSRKHLIFFNKNGLLSIAGGKLTTWRKMAEDLFEMVIKENIFSDITREKGFSKQKFHIGFQEEDWLQSLKNYTLSLDNKTLHHIYQQYGRGAIEIMNLIEAEPYLGKKILEENDFIKAEIVYILRHELTTHLIDVFCRRTEMSLFIDHRKSPEAAEIVADLMAKEYSWSEEKKNMEIQQYLEYRKQTVSFL
ncbi:MAG: glycerol-3-phosphate dehydrogenase/oxidase [Promethearchaeota archaeon]|jgi:glycerol-3-phosphate dehydrogenase